jgi:hypothetical protein
MISMEKPPIACTLTAADYRDRQGAWLKLEPFVRSSGAIPGGLSFIFAPATGLPASLAELVRLEAECCAWMAFAIAESADAVRLAITADGEDGERGVREAFAPLTSR